VVKSPGSRKCGVRGEGCSDAPRKALSAECRDCTLRRRTRARLIGAASRRRRSGDHRAGREWQMPQGGIDPGRSLAGGEAGTAGGNGRDLGRDRGRVAGPGALRLSALFRSAAQARRVPWQEQAWVAMRFLGHDSTDRSGRRRLGAARVRRWRWELSTGVGSRRVLQQPVYERVATALRPGRRGDPGRARPTASG
jgi:hypothetical protein